MGQIWSQIEKLVFLEIWNVPWRISMATSRRGTFTCTGHTRPEYANNERMRCGSVVIDKNRCGILGWPYLVYQAIGFIALMMVA